MKLHKPLAEYTQEEWEALCDGCALCCLEKLEITHDDGDSNAICEMFISGNICEYLDINTCKCSDYNNRHKNVPSCTAITAKNIHQLYWLPHTCAYRLIAEGKPLPEWHHLICGDREKVHKEGHSVLDMIEHDD